MAINEPQSLMILNLSKNIWLVIKVLLCPDRQLAANN